MKKFICLTATILLTVVMCFCGCASTSPAKYFSDEEIEALDKTQYDSTGYVIALGGGFDQNDEQRSIIVKRSVELCGKQNPNMLFMASGHNDEIEENEDYMRLYAAHGCNVDSLRPSAEPYETIVQKISSADIIYETGGNLNGLTTIWGNAGVFPLMRQAFDRGAVLVGVSTGAMCWAEMGYDNSSEEEVFRVVTDFPFLGKEAEYDYYYATGILPFCICPHFDNVAYRHFGRKAAKLDVPSLAIENGVAVVYHQGLYSMMVDPMTPHRKCYLYYPAKGIKKVNVTDSAELVHYVDAYRRTSGYKAHDQV